MSNFINYKPPRWLQSGHLQTLMGRFYRSSVTIDYERLRINTPDGDFLDLDFHPSINSFQNCSKNILLIHGLEGCSRSAYIKTTVNHLSKAGFGTVVLNLRSCSGEPNRTKKFYHSGSTHDLKTSLNHLERQFNLTSLGAIGFSLGGNILLKHLGETRNQSIINKSAAVSVPFDLSSGADYINQGFSRVYEKYFLTSLKQKLLRKERTRNHGYDLSDLGSINTLRKFDDRYTAPLHGFNSAENYYQKSSSKKYLKDIRTNTLLIQSRDDPFVPDEAIPESTISGNDNLKMLLTDRGGHVAFLRKSGFTGLNLWLEPTLVNFFNGSLPKT